MWFISLRALALVVWASVLMMSAPAWAQRPEDVPNPRAANAWVSDMANVIDAERERQLNAMIDEFKRRTGAEIAVVTIRRAQGRTPKEFATELLNRWGIGERGRDKGVLVLLALEDRRIEVETGYGVEPFLPDGQIGEILDEYVLPQFRQGDYGQGLLAGVQAMIGILKNASWDVVPSAEKRPSGFPFGTLVLLLIAAAVGYGLWRSRRRLCPQCHRPMRRLTEEQDDAYLEVAQRFEEEIGSVDYRVWRCDECQINHIEPAIRWFSGYEECPQCGHRTVSVRSYRLREPTYEREGLEEICRSCRFIKCGYETVSKHRIPRRERPVIVVSGGGASRGGGGWTSSGSSGGWGGGGFSRGGGSFGGGRSGGGGAGRSF